MVLSLKIPEGCNTIILCEKSSGKALFCLEFPRVKQET